MSASTEHMGEDRPRALVVDDDALLRRVVRSALVQGGFDVAQVGTGRDALSLATAYELDVIVTDLEMPGMGGLELLRALRDRQLDTPLVVMSGAPEARRELIIESGAFSFLAKPFGMEELLRVARSAVERGRIAPPPISAVVPARRVGKVA